MIRSWATWFRELAPRMRLAVAGGGVTIVAAAVFLCAGLAAVLVALGIGGLVTLGLLGFQRFLGHRVRQRKAAFASGLIDDVKGARAEIGERFARALEELRANHVDIYALPWYFYLGEPQSGKTFTIKTSGVDLPLGTQGISGAGGTRDCDFWFTSEAVILDTAGRLTLHDDEIIDREQWAEVLRFLVRCRPNCPINGVILGIPCTSLLEDDGETIQRKAEAIARRLKELQTTLKVHFPVFLVVLKTDLVLGFEPFFKRLPVLERKQLLGWANPGRFDQPFSPEGFARAFDQVVEALRRWRLKFLGDETTTEAIDQFYPLPDEFTALKQPLQSYLDRIFMQGPYGQAGFFRGFFFTSSLQEGRAIPHAIRSILGGIGEDRPAALDLRSVEARSTPFFVREFYIRKVFPEKGLLLRSDRSRLVNALIRGAALWGGAAVLLLGIAILILRIPSVRGTLSRPARLVEQIRDGVYNADRPFQLCTELGDEIDRLEKEGAQGSAPAALFEVFFPHPAGDCKLITHLKAAYQHRLWDKHLGPFYKKALTFVEGSASAGAPHREIHTWSDFEQRRTTFRELVAAAAAAEPPDTTAAGERFAALVRAVGDVDTAKPATPDYNDRLQFEYARFVRFGGQIGPLLLASGPGGKDEFWTRLERASQPLRQFLAGRVDVKTLDGADGADVGDALASWRRCLKAAAAFQESYGELQKVTSRAVDDEAPLPVSELTRTSYQEIADRWRAKFAEVARVWKELEQACRAASDDGPLESRLDRLKADLVDSYSELAGNAVLDRCSDSGAKRLGDSLRSESARSVQRLEESFRNTVLSRFDGANHLVRRAGSSGASAAEAAAGITQEAAGVFARLALLNDIVAGDPKELTKKWSVPERRSLEIASFAADITGKYEAYRAFMAAPLGVAAPRWGAERLRVVIDTLAAGALTTLFAGVLDEYFEWAEVQAEPKRLAFFDWFRKRGDPEGRPVGLFAAAADEAFLASAYQGHDTQINALVAFVEGRAAPDSEPGTKGNQTPAPDYRLFETFDLPHKDRLLDLRNRYEKAYLDSWKERILSAPLWTNRGHAYDAAAGDSNRWESFQRDLAAGLGHSSVRNLAANLRKSAGHAATHVTVLPLERRRSATGHAWCAVLDPYLGNEGTGGTLEQILIEFQESLVARLDGKDPAKALAEVRRQRGLWLDRKIEEFCRQNQLEGDLFAQKLLDLAESGKRLLATDALKQFEQEWTDLAGPWGPKLAGKFPFNGDLPVSAARLAAGPIDQVSPDDLRELLRPGGRIRALCERYLACFPDADDPYGLDAGQPRIAFLKACQALQRLLLAGNTSDFREVKFKIVLPGGPGSATRAEAAGGGRDVFSLSPFCVRFSAGRGSREARIYETTPRIEDLSWMPAPGGAEEGLTEVEVLDRDRKTQRDDGMPLAVKMQGPWSFLLYLRTFGTPTQGGRLPGPREAPKTADRREWFMRSRLGKDQPGRGPVIVYFLIELDGPMEPLPDWNEAMGAK
ncbi:MAG: hypothetical protein JXQ29_08765 [Planctomycetes bacterium]|nr:hypothetical protein [Planctomycetota bacterium]